MTAPTNIVARDEAVVDGGALARVLPGSSHGRHSATGVTVAAALSDDGVALVEAGTGTGKTIAYLIPAILSGKRVLL